MRRFLIDRINNENVNVVQPKGEVEEPPPNVTNKFNPNEIVRDPNLRKQIHVTNSCVCSGYSRPSDEGTYILKGPMQPNLPCFPRTQFGKGILYYHAKE
ncbi:hypothetical protein MTR_2g099105 [Medicago truncatula]|uniref:Uncharacterized protein n=1 Tax=Medicago truncatula TaxID=3880 RepID=A0A072VDH9_MEDTR|nr:hypothetical protein MTR_2g099105 [Medicago truncatula]